AATGPSRQASLQSAIYLLHIAMSRGASETSRPARLYTPPPPGYDARSPCARASTLGCFAGTSTLGCFEWTSTLRCLKLSGGGRMPRRCCAWTIAVVVATGSLTGRAAAQTPTPARPLPAPPAQPAPPALPADPVVGNWRGTLKSSSGTESPIVITI